MLDILNCHVAVVVEVGDDHYEYLRLYEVVTHNESSSLERFDDLIRLDDINKAIIKASNFDQEYLDDFAEGRMVVDRDIGIMLMYPLNRYEFVRALLSICTDNKVNPNHWRIDYL